MSIFTAPWDLPVDILAARRLRVVKTARVFATQYGGPDDPSTPHHFGSYGDDLNTRWRSFAELSTNLRNSADDPRAAPNDYAALGKLIGLPHGLPHTALVRVHYHGRSMLLRKRDVGFGGPGPDGRRGTKDDPRIDLWWKAARKLGHNGFDYVTIDILR